MAKQSNSNRRRIERRRAGTVRLDRALSKLGVASRAEAARLIAGGRVTVSGRLVTNAATLVNPDRTAIAVDARQVRRQPWRTLLLHKPRGVVTTRRDPDGRRTVFDVLGDEADGLVSAGRLDLASTGLLILTTDTRLANWITDPEQSFRRRYVVTVRGAVTDEEAERIVLGIGSLSADRAIVRKRSERESNLLVDLTEGQNREIRRLMEGIGHEVTRLKRVAFGGLELGELAPGRWRNVTVDEITSAFPGVPVALSRS